MPLSNASTELLLRQKARSGANWFFWIAGLSIINSIAIHSGSTWSFTVGLGLTQLVDGAITQEAPNARIIAILFDAFAAGVFILVGYAARKYRMVILVGLAFYGFDSLIYLLIQSWFGVAIHVLIIFFIVQGYLAAGKVAKIDAEAALQSNAPIGPA